MATPEVAARVGEPKKLENVSEEELKAILKEYYDKWVIYHQIRDNTLDLVALTKFIEM